MWEANSKMVMQGHLPQLTILLLWGMTQLTMLISSVIILMCYTFLFYFWSRYHVPRSWFQPSGNTLVVFEEKGGDPTKITFSSRVVTSVCSYVSENYPSIDLESWDNRISGDGINAATVQLSCPKGKNISSVKFASFGNPSGTCRSYQQGSCHHPNSLAVVEKACLNTNSCTISLSEEGFGKDLCPGVTKTLAIEADCSQ